MNFLACLLLFVCVPEDQQAAITLKDGTRIEGTLIVPEKLKLETGFGEASIRASQLWRAFFG